MLKLLDLNDLLSGKLSYKKATVTVTTRKYSMD